MKDENAGNRIKKADKGGRAIVEEWKKIYGMALFEITTKVGAKKRIAAVKGLGVDLFDFDGTPRNLSDVLKDLCDAIDTEQDMALADTESDMETYDDLISRSTLLEEMARIELETEDDVKAWIAAGLLIENVPAVPYRTEKFVRCAECDDCHWSEESGMYLCGNVLGMSGALDPGNGDGCSHGKR